MLLASVATHGLLESKSFPVEITAVNSEYSGVVAENYGGHIASEDNVLHVTGNNKIYLVEDWFNLMDWPLVKYQKLHLLGSIMSFTVDMSGVACDCNAAVYLVAMDEPGPEGANYCDIQATPPYPRCTEIDLVEGNIHAFATTVHTTEGTGVSRSHFQPATPAASASASNSIVSRASQADGTCNQDGCARNLGKLARTPAGERTSDLYGPHSHKINTQQPFEVKSTFLSDGQIIVELVQEGRTLTMYDSDLAGNPEPGGVPAYAFDLTKQALMGGMVLVVSLWSAADDGLAWLQGPADRCGPKCDLSSTTFKVSGLSIVPIPPPPKPPPSPSPPPPSPLPPPPPPLPPPSPPPEPGLGVSPTMLLGLLLIASAGAVAWKLHRGGSGGTGGGGSRPRAVPLTTKPFKVVDDDAEVLIDDDDLPEAPRPKKGAKAKKGEGRASGEKKGKKSKKQSSRVDDEPEGGGGDAPAAFSARRRDVGEADDGEAPVAFGTRRKSDSGTASEEPRRSGARRDPAASSRATSKRSKQDDDVRLLDDPEGEAPRRSGQARAGGKNHAARIRAEFNPGPTLD